MPLMLDTMRAEFARFLADDPQGRFRMDKALAHVITLAYERGLDDGRRAAIFDHPVAPTRGAPGTTERSFVEEAGRAGAGVTPC
jgi:hypothetical protein